MQMPLSGPPQSKVSTALPPMEHGLVHIALPPVMPMQMPAQSVIAASGSQTSPRPLPTLGESTHTPKRGSHTRPSHGASEPHVGTQTSEPSLSVRHVTSSRPWHLSGSSSSSRYISSGVPNVQPRKHSLLPLPSSRHVLPCPGQS